MSYKVVVSAQISRAIRRFGMPRQILLDLFWEIHEGIALKYDPATAVRAVDLRYSFYRIILSDDTGQDHLFVLLLDDSTSPDHLFINNIGYEIL